MKGCYVQKQELKLDFIREICRLFAVAATTESHQKAQNASNISSLFAMFQFITVFWSLPSFIACQKAKNASNISSLFVLFQFITSFGVFIFMD